MGTKYSIENTKYPYQGSIDKSYRTNSFIKFIFNLAILFVLMVFKKYDFVDISIRTISKKDQRKESKRLDIRDVMERLDDMSPVTISADKITTGTITSDGIDNYYGFGKKLGEEE